MLSSSGNTRIFPLSLWSFDLPFQKPVVPLSEITLKNCAHADASVVRGDAIVLPQPWFFATFFKSALRKRLLVDDPPRRRQRPRYMRKSLPSGPRRAPSPACEPPPIQRLKYLSNKSSWSAFCPHPMRGEEASGNISFRLTRETFSSLAFGFFRVNIHRAPFAQPHMLPRPTNRVLCGPSRTCQGF